MSDFDLTGELSLKSELHMLRPITEKVHSGNGPVSLVRLWLNSIYAQPVTCSKGSNVPFAVTRHNYFKQVFLVRNHLNLDFMKL